jgi:hypothetical protein
MYLFRHDQTAQRSMSAGQMQQATRKWMGWLEALEKNGHFIQVGERLDGTGRFFTRRSMIPLDAQGRVMPDGA